MSRLYQRKHVVSICVAFRILRDLYFEAFDILNVARFLWGKTDAVRINFGSRLGGRSTMAENRLAPGWSAAAGDTSANDASFAGSRSRDGHASTIRDQIAQKEREMARLAEARLTEIEEDNERLRAEVQKMDKLKLDFEYNIKLIHDRDAELTRLEAERDQLQQSVEDEQLEIKRMKTSSA